MSAAIALQILRCLAPPKPELEPLANRSDDLIEVIGEILAPCRDVNGCFPLRPNDRVRPGAVGVPAHPFECPDCLGEGKHNAGWPNPMTEVDCPTCQGSGETL